MPAVVARSARHRARAGQSRGQPGGFAPMNADLTRRRCPALPMSTLMWLACAVVPCSLAQAANDAHVAASPFACVEAPADLVAWWPGEDSTLDRMGNFHGTASHGIGYTTGLVGRGFLIDGVNDSIDVGMLDGLALNESASFSIVAWIDPVSVAGTAMRVIAANYMGEGGGIGNFSTFLRVGSGTLWFHINERQLAETMVSAPIDHLAHLVGATYDGTTLRLYIDGELVGSAERSFSGSGDNTRGWTLGNFSDATNTAHGYSSPFNGLLDEVLLFRRALSQSEIAAINAAAVDGVCLGLVFADGFEGG
jgi:hypothetical protein